MHSNYNLLAISMISVLGLAGCQKEELPPNFLILLTDDQRPNTLTCYDKTCPIPSPNIDGLASRGIRFTNAFVTSPICCVSRGCIQTGRYAGNNRMHYFNYPLPDDVLENSYPVHLRKSGYFVGSLGKYGIGVNAKVKESFDVFEAQENQGPAFRQYKGKKMHDAEWLTVKTDEFLDKLPPGKPFCLQVNYKEPHFTSEPAPEDDHLLDDYLFPRELTDTPEEFQKLPAIVRNGYGGMAYEIEFNVGGDHNPFMRWYHEKVASVDRSVGEILRNLEKRGLAKNTVIIFLSDHGQHNGEKQLFGKWTPYEQSLNIPFIVYDPRRGSEKPVVSEEMILNIDVAPTILDMAGIPVPAIMDGMSLAELLKGKHKLIRDHFFFEHYCSPSQAKRYIPRNEGLRTSSKKYVRWTDVSPVIEQYFDLVNDPMERYNLINDPDYSDEISEARNQFKAWRENNPVNYDFFTYDKRPQWASKNIDWDRFRISRPEFYEKIQSQVKEMNVTWEQAEKDLEVRYQISEKVKYWY